jgi:hypothetical protein
MIVKVTPDLIDEIKRAESHGDVARIKFDVNANNTSGNVIDVGGKDFRFTWSREMGDLCDIYEERRGGEDGNGLLVESGGAWRKLNVQRVLDETTQNNLKMRSEEAQLQKKSRKAIILDPANSSMKNQSKSFAAAEVNTWRSKQNKEPPPFKKRKAELLSVGGPPKTTIKSSTTPLKRGRLSASPLASTPDQSGAPPSPFGLNKNHSLMENITPPPAAFTKEMSNRIITGTVQDNRQVKKGFSGGQSQPTDLRSLLISLLMENPKGMSIKALEKAVGETYPNSTKQMESIIKKIANYQSPGRYILKPVVESEGSFSKLSSESGSSPEDNQHQIPDNMEKMASLEPSFLTKSLDRQQIELNSRPEEESNVLETEKVDIELNSPPDEKKTLDNREGPTGSASVSGSESDSDSESSSGSESGSHRSPVGSNSTSSSDTETDDDEKASTNSKMASDEDVDIMSGDDDNKEPNNILEPSVFGGPFLHNRVEIEKDLPGNDNFDPGNRIEIHPEAAKDSSPDHQEHQQSMLYSGNSHVEKNSKGKPKRGSDGKHADNIPDRGTKRHKPGKSTQSQTLDKPLDIQTFANRGPVEDGADFGVLKDYNNQALFPGKSVSDSQQSGRRSIDSVWPRPISSVERPVLKLGEKSVQGNEGGYLNEDVSLKKSKPTNRTDVNRSLVINGRGPVLQREVSDLELGELRETNEVPGGVKKQFERKTSFKQSENKPTSSSDYWNSDISRGKPATKTNLSDSVNHNVEELTRGRAVPAHPNHTPNVDHAEAGSHFRRSLGNGVEGYGDTHKKLPVHLQQQRGMVSNMTSKEHKSSNGLLSVESNGRVKQREPPLDDEANCPYAKYDKEDPQIKGPIKDLDQFEEYLQEYKEKYDSYIALNKILQSWRDEFLPYEKEYENAKLRDMDRYHKLREEINEKYQPIKHRFLRLKRILCVLHHEVKQLKELIRDFGDEYTKDS